jgi:hypothetical protein
VELNFTEPDAALSSLTDEFDGEKIHVGLIKA